MSKFSNITFPFFGKTKQPNNLFYSTNKIEIRNDEKTILVDYIDEYNKNLTYLQRLHKFDYDPEFSSIDRIKFDYTFKSLSNLIMTSKKINIKWGVDNTGKIIELNKKEKFKFKCTKYDKIKEELLWIKGISYPFNLINNREDNINKFMFIYLVYIDYTWFIYDICYDYIDKDYIYL